MVLPIFSNFCFLTKKLLIEIFVEFLFGVGILDLQLLTCLVQFVEFMSRFCRPQISQLFMFGNRDQA